MTLDQTNDELTPDLKAKIDGLPREIQPERALWPEIESVIAASKVVRPDFRGQAATTTSLEAGVNWRRMGLLAAAAMLLVAFSSGITAYLVQIPESAGVAPAAGPARTTFQTVAWDGFLQAEQSYQSITNDLLADLEAHRSELAPETVEIVERNLRLIDHAIAEARAALERDPANTKLVGKLTGMYRTKMTFLEEMSRL